VTVDHGDIARKTRRQDRELSRWIERLGRIIKLKVHDAEAHLGNAATEVLKQTPDGRSTLLKSRNGRSYVAAMTRLDELLTALCGPSMRSLDGLVRDAREEFYRLEFAEWLPHVSDDVRVKSGKPTLKQVDYVRGLVLHGVELRHEIELPIDRSKRLAASALVLASRQGSTSQQTAGAIRLWARNAHNRISSAVATALSDSQMAVDTLASRDVVQPEYLDNTPVVIGE
jgi:hypothetical protein